MKPQKEYKEALTRLRIETPAWGYADSGTRFKTFKQKGAARNIFEKLEDAACVHKFTGIAPSISVHVPRDINNDNVEEVTAYAKSLGVKIGTINPGHFEYSEYKLGSIAHPDPKTQKKAVAHIMECIELMRTCGTKYLNLWFADGTNYPGQDDLRKRKRRVAENLKEVYEALDEKMTMLIEYKLFEPSFYSTDIADWGMAYLFARQCGPKARVLVDLGHHPLGTNIEQIVAFLIDENMLGAFHFNSKKYADDDLTTGSVNPYELFLIFNELVAAAGGDGLYEAAYVIDQSHNVKPKLEAMIQSIVNIQETCAKALLVDRVALRKAQESGDIITAEQILKNAFFTDVKPLLKTVREKMSVAADPLQAYRQSNYQQEIESKRS